MELKGDRRAEFFRRINWHYSRCLDPTLTCAEKPIRAHSIQNARVIDLLEKDGHVIAPKLELDGNQPRIRFQRVGRNIASTFPGFCQRHDAELFRTLDNTVFDRNNLEQIFQLAYRSVTKELHATMQAGVQIQSAYLWRVQNNLDPKDSPSEAGILAVEKLNIAFETWEYRNQFFDTPAISCDWKMVEHDVFELKDQSPSIAVSSLFSFAGIERDGELVRCVLNIFPVNDATTQVVFSYAPPDASMARQMLDRILSSSGEYQKYEISKLIISRIENFLISPNVFEKWNKGKIDAIAKAFASTILNDSPLSDDSRLMLF